MNYYEHHLGDYAAATAHLSWDEDMAYTRLLRAYYHHERGIPEGQQYRLARATTPAQRRAVDAVLVEFFKLVAGHFTQKRADAEIERYQDKQRKAKASAEARWSKSERNANASPKSNANAMRTHSEGNTLQTPDTIPNNPPPPAGVSPPSGRATKKCPASFAITDELRQWAQANAPHVGVEAETEKFRDHSFATARSDWAGTWRNWIRKAEEAAASRPRSAQSQAASEPAWRTEQRNRMREFAGADLVNPAPQRQSAEVIDVTPRLVG